MSKSDISMILVGVAWFIAFVVYKNRKPAKSVKVPSDTNEDPPPVVVSQPPAAQEQAPSPPVSGTPRERRLEALRSLGQTGKCVYCSSPAQKSFPYAEFSLHSIGISHLIKLLAGKTFGDLPKHWTVAEDDEGAPTLCESHATLARSAVEVRIASAHAEYVEFISAQKRSVLEHRAHGLDEDLSAEADRVRKGSPRRSQ